MPRFSADTEIIGFIVLSVLGVQREALRLYFAKFGIEQYQPDVWYPVGPLVEVLNDLRRTRSNLDSIFDFVSVGVPNAMAIPLPPDTTLEDALRGMDEGYYQFYRGSDPGGITVQQVGESHFTVSFRWPWPDGLAYGLVHGLGMRMIPTPNFMVVYYDESLARADDGGEQTVIHISW